MVVVASRLWGIQKLTLELWKRTQTSWLFQRSSCVFSSRVAVTWLLDPSSSVVKLSPSLLWTIFDSRPASKKSILPSMSKKSPPGLALFVHLPSKRLAASCSQASPLPQISLAPESSATWSGACGSVVLNLSPPSASILLSAPPTTLSVPFWMTKILSPGFFRGVHRPSNFPATGIQTSPLVQTIFPSFSSPALCGFHPCSPVVNLLSPCGKRPNSMSSTKCMAEPWMVQMLSPGASSSVQRPSKGPMMWSSTTNACAGPFSLESACTCMFWTPK
mmetsp:Transcript_65138/g.194186  ORF Transcript_65138/g.194186 Transcript_65138/m.194186 type:complete len:275 (-) Transcript_65138:393-1217(-)